MIDKGAEPAYSCDWSKVYAVDALKGASLLEPQSIHTIVTSPPYWGLRSYLDKDDPNKAMELGAEKTPEEYVEKLVEVFRALRPALRDDGVLWLNLGDSFASSGVRSTGRNDTERDTPGGRGDSFQGGERRATGQFTPGLKPKDLVGIPWMVAFALRADGWYLRSDIVWSKPNPMPESVTDRPTKSHEYMFMLTKSPRYFFDNEAVREPHTMKPQRVGPRQSPVGPYAKATHAQMSEPGVMGHPAGRNIRSVWNIATAPYPGSHYAVFPPALVYPCIKAGTSEYGVCERCLSPWKRVVERRAGFTDGLCNGCRKPRNKHIVSENSNKPESGAKHSWTKLEDGAVPCGANSTVGWQPTCSCQKNGTKNGAETIPATVLDPFIGSGTTAFAARKLGRRSIGFDLDARNIEQIEGRLGSQGVLL